jgi:outer membrane protein TolC
MNDDETSPYLRAAGGLPRVVFCAAALALIALGAPIARAEPAAQLERELSQAARPRAILKLALERNPELSEAGARAEAAREWARSASRLPDPELEYRLWAAPLARPHALDEAEMHMLGIRQAWPAPGSLAARGRALDEQALIRVETRRALELDLTARVWRAYAAYVLKDQEHRLHLEHGVLLQQWSEVVQAAYRGGAGSQEQVLRATLTVARLHRAVGTLETELEAARAELNALMARPVDAPLGPPARLEPVNVEVRLRSLREGLSARRPELRAAASSVRASQHELDEARASGRWPSFMLGLDYMYMPLRPEPHHYGIMATVSLPWLNPSHAEEARSREASSRAEVHALSSMQRSAELELYAAAQRFEAAQRSLRSVESELLPLGERALAAARASYGAGAGDARSWLEAAESLLDLRLERERALFELATALSDLERAAGVSLTSPLAERGK